MSILNHEYSPDNLTYQRTFKENQLEYFKTKVKFFYKEHSGRDAFFIALAFIEGLSYSQSKADIEALEELNEQLADKAIQAEYDYNNM